MRPRARRGQEPSLSQELAALLASTFVPDLRERVRQPAVAASLRHLWSAERTARRTADDFDEWTEHTVEQVGAAWILSCVFVRTLEDRGLLERRRLAGDGALDSQEQFFAIAPSLTEREYVLTVFRELAAFPGAADVLGRAHNPAWRLAPSNDSVRALLALLRRTNDDGQLRLRFDGSDTRRLGELYQHLSESVRKRYALLQTPEFVERFILQETLAPAVHEFGLETVQVIDPTCGSGHFLLGAFEFLFDARLGAAPGVDRREHAAQALAQVFGIDVNPYAVAIARFRLTLSYMDRAGITRLAAAPRIETNLVVADSLLHRGKDSQVLLSSVAQEQAVWGDQMFALDEPERAIEICAARYHVVVGNPPYITCDDSVLREEYRRAYKSAAGKYALAAPFTERFFQLAIENGFVGLINSNAWTKRDYGTALIHDVLRHLDVTKIVDTSGCYIPGHGTPTLLLFGRNRLPATDRVVAVLGKRGERSEPGDPAAAPVWSEIKSHHDEVGFEGAHVSVEAIDRSELAVHPWILSGGGARGLYEMLNQRAPTLSRLVSGIGFAAFSGEDSAFLVPAGWGERSHVEASAVRAMVKGEDIRDWAITPDIECLCPYDPISQELLDRLPQGLERRLWPSRTTLGATLGFGGATRSETAKAWWEWSRWIPDRNRSRPAIVNAYVHTHNNFCRAVGGQVYRGGASVNYLDVNKTLEEESVTAVLGYLNSSTTGFWCRLVMFPKGGDQVGEGARLSKTPWQDRLEYAGNLLLKLPVPDLALLRTDLLELVGAVEDVTRRIGEVGPNRVIAAALSSDPSLVGLRNARNGMVNTRSQLRAVLVSLQEELDWRVYGHFGLPTVVAPSVAAVAVPVDPNHRPFEVRLARDVATDVSASEWFRIHQRSVPDDVGGPLVDLYRQRLDLLDDPVNGRLLRLLETPETKRRWSPVDDTAEFAAAARGWLLERAEQFFRDQPQAELRSVRQLALGLSGDRRVRALHELLAEQTGHDLIQLLSDLISADAVPFLAALRYTASGIEKRASWEECWELQRAEDTGTLAEELRRRMIKAIPKPKKYARIDFERHYWSLRGELDVPKERFISHPGAERDEDTSPLIGWGGWHYLQRAQALAQLYRARREEDGWEPERLIAILAGLHELVPWLLQWHNEPSTEFDGQRMGEVYQGFVAEKARELGVRLDELSGWRPPRRTRARRGAGDGNG